MKKWILMFALTLVACSTRQPINGTAIDDINDRVFIRLCITQSNHKFDRLGNTKNPFIKYPLDFKWNDICDPSVSLIQPLCFKTSLEFKKLWNVSCIGHHAFAICNQGKKSYQYKLLNELRKRTGLQFVKSVIKLYNKNDVIELMRSELLLSYFI